MATEEPAELPGLVGVAAALPAHVELLERDDVRVVAAETVGDPREIHPSVEAAPVAHVPADDAELGGGAQSCSRATQASRSRERSTTVRFSSMARV